jgi:hypothetical protein
MVRQMLHEYATAISTAGHANRSRRLIKCAKDSGHFRMPLGAMGLTGSINEPQKRYGCEG